MTIKPRHLKAAFDALSTDEQNAVLLSTTQKHSRTGVTNFTAALIAQVMNSLRCRKTIRASFKGNLGGQNSGARGGLTRVKRFAKEQFASVGCQLKENEILVDFLVTGQDVLDVSMTVESEARPIAPRDDLHDFNKLLLVWSPYRVFVSRVNVTKNGLTHKVESAIESIQSHWSTATSRNIVQPNSRVAVVLLETSVRMDRRAYVAQRLGPGPLEFDKVLFT